MKALGLALGLSSLCLAAPAVETERGLRSCEAGCGLFLGPQGLYPARSTSSGALSGLSAGRYLHRLSTVENGPLLQRLPYAVYALPHPPTRLPRNPGVDVTSLATAPAALLLSEFHLGPGSNPWIAVPTELLALPNSSFSYHPWNHPVGFAYGFQTSAILRDRLEIDAYHALAVEVDGGFYRLHAGGAMRLYSTRGLGLESIAFSVRLDLLPETWGPIESRDR